MKRVIDLEALRDEGKISSEEYQRLSPYASEAITSLALNIVLTSGLVAVCSALFIFFSSPLGAIGLGVMFSSLGLILLRRKRDHILGRIFAVIGGVVLGAGCMEQYINTYALDSQPLVHIRQPYFMMLPALIIVGIAARSRPLGVITMIVVAINLLSVMESMISVVIGILLLLSLFLYYLSRWVPSTHCTMVQGGAWGAFFCMHVVFLFVSMGFDTTYFSAPVFAITWAVLLIGSGFWAWKNRKVWLLNMMTLFAGTHLYIQWVHYVGETPTALLIIGIVLSTLALGVRKLNERMV